MCNDGYYLTIKVTQPINFLLICNSYQDGIRHYLHMSCLPRAASGDRIQDAGYRSVVISINLSITAPYLPPVYLILWTSTISPRSELVTVDSRYCVDILNFSRYLRLNICGWMARRLDTTIRLYFVCRRACINVSFSITIWQNFLQHFEVCCTWFKCEFHAWEGTLEYKLHPFHSTFGLLVTKIKIYRVYSYTQHYAQ